MSACLICDLALSPTVLGTACVVVGAAMLLAHWWRP